MKKARIIFTLATATLLTVGGLSSCSNSTQETLKYNINKDDVAGANISIDKKEAKVGELVTVTIEVSDSTKVIDKVLANSLAIGKDNNGKYSFTMPNENVTISVLLKEKEVTAFKATIKNVEGVTLTLSKTTDLKAGEVVSGKATTTSLTKFISHILVNNLKVGINDSDGTFSFVMPKENVEVEANLELLPVETTYNITIEEVSGATLTITNTQNINAGSIVSGEVKVNDDSKIIDHVLVGELKVAVGVDGKLSFIMPASNVTIKVVLKDALTQISYNATIVETQGVTLTLSKTTGLLPGETITGSINITDNTKLLSHILVNTTKVVVDDNNNFSFVVPNQDVTLTPILVDDPNEILYPVVINENSLNHEEFKPSIIDPITKEEVSEAKEGTKLRLYLQNLQVEGVEYEVTDIRIFKEGATEFVREVDIYSEWDSTVSTLRNYYYDFTFTKDIKSIAFYPSKLKYDISYSFKGCEGIDTNLTKKANTGDTIRIYPKISTGFEVESVIVKDSEDNLIPVDLKYKYENSNEVYYEFEMPSKKVFVTINCVPTTDLIYVSTDANASVSNFRKTEAGTGTTEVIEANSKMNLAFVAREGENVYFDISTISEDYLIEDAYYLLEGSDSKHSININDNVANFTMPKGNVEIKIETKKAFVPFTVETPEGTTLEFYLKEGEKYQKLEGKLPTSYEKIYFKLIDNNATEDSFRDLETLKIQVNENGVDKTPTDFLTSSTSKADEYYWKWFEATGDSIKFIATTKTKNIVFKDKEFVGKYKGSKASMVEDWYGWGDLTVETTYAEIDVTGCYYSGTSSNGGLGSQVLTLNEDNKTLLQDGTIKFIYDNGWLLDVKSSVEESNILKKDSTADVSDVKTLKIDGNSKKALVQQKIGSNFYHYVDLETNTFIGNATINFLSGTSLSSGSVIEVKQQDKVITTLEATSSTGLKTVVPDGVGGTYTSTIPSNLGTLTLNGYGSATASNYEYSDYKYTVEDNIVTLIGHDRGATPKVIRKVTIDKEKKTFIDNNIQTDLIDFSTLNLTSNINVEGSTLENKANYKIYVTLNSTTIRIQYALVNEDGVVSTTKNELTSSYPDIVYDLSGEVIKIKLDEKDNFLNQDSLYLTYLKTDTGVKVHLNGTNVSKNSNSVVFNFNNLELV